MKTQSIDDTRKFFDDRGKLFNKVDWVSDKVLMCEIVASITNHEPTTLLDLGIGTGVIEKNLPSSIAITGVDKSGVMCQISRNLLPDARIFQNDIQDLSFLRGEMFDLIFSRATLGHVPIFQVIEKLGGHLTKSGRIVLCESISYSDSDELYQLEFHNLIHPGHVEFPTHDAFIAMFEKLNYRIESARVLYTTSDTVSLFSSLKSEKLAKHIYRYLCDLKNRGVTNDWCIEMKEDNITYRRPWLLLVAKSKE